MKCRETGIVAEIFQRMGMSTVNMPGGEIAAAAQRGVIDCAEWVTPAEDMTLGLHEIYKYYYMPGMHEPSVVAEVIINADVWKSLPAQQQEAIRSAVTETYVRWWVKWQKQNADALEEMRTKFGTQVLRTPPEILTAFLKAWDEIAAEESAKNPVFKKVYDSQRHGRRKWSPPSASCPRPTLSPPTTTGRRKRPHQPRRRLNRPHRPNRLHRLHRRRNSFSEHHQ